MFNIVLNKYENTEDRVHLVSHFPVFSGLGITEVSKHFL